MDQEGRFSKNWYNYMEVVTGPGPARYTDVVLAWWPLLVLVSAVFGAALLFLYPFSGELPMDDAYIHFAYAENLSSRGELIFSSPGEDGLGVTSPLWVLLLSSGVSLGFPVQLTAKALGLVSLVLVSSLLYFLLKIYMPWLVAFCAALLVGLSGNMLWFALSGMETMLFVALGLIALGLYWRQRMVWLGIVLGLLILTRPEGLALAVAFILVELFRQRTMSRDLYLLIIVCGLISLPWFLYLYWRTGYVIPTSAIGKQVSFQTGIQVVAGRYPWLTWIGQFPPLVYIGSWITYLVLFVLGGMALPGPYLPIGTLVGYPHYAISIWALPVWLFIILPLLVAAIRRARGVRQWLPDRRVILALVLWVILHNVFYMFFLPVPGTASRYGAINYVLIWPVLVAGVWGLVRRYPRAWWLLLGLLIIALTGTWYWNKVYDANLEHMQQVRIAAADFVQQLPEGERCAVFDIGAIGYFSKRPIVDLGGLIDPAAAGHFLSGSYDRYLLEQGATCLILPGDMNTTRDGWFDMAQIMGFTTSPLFTLEPIAEFEIDRDRWLLGYLPTNNYQASVTIYQVQPVRAK